MSGTGVEHARDVLGSGGGELSSGRIRNCSTAFIASPQIGPAAVEPDGGVDVRRADGLAVEGDRRAELLAPATIAAVARFGV